MSTARRDDLYMTLARCPQCGYRRYDTIAEACERRLCGYEGRMEPLPEGNPPAPVNDRPIDFEAEPDA